MKRFLVSWPVLLLAVFVVSSCGKEKSVEEDVSQYYIKCKIGSVDKTFKYALTAQKVAVSSTETNYTFSGQANKDPNNLEGVGFTIRFQIPPATGTTYKETDPTNDYLLACIYNPNTNDQSKMFSSDGAEDNPFQITFTEITATSISGTFSGKLYPLTSSDHTGDSAVLSNGQFKLKLQ
ncbi:hypothetical protein A4H97_25920 [Niastella yeongjuensis]|uniref:Lipoprotein n=1 Tax=Niastella yeongjuensis TaxID=354355 RepID=A0A1V9F0Z3_9BACT|nr:hypothetical protein [Niastella yeongjuensis]OQP52053.1 hypothetical protein A4H97_25920 [Niastella yeongjuensis]SEP37041.1 hypothetical protein SAMN05660816_05531 [Niastella yeongjuensis]